MGASAVATGGAAAREEVRRALTGKGVDWRGAAFRALLLLTLVIALVVLIALLVDVALTAIPYLQERGGGFLSSGTSSLPGSSRISLSHVPRLHAAAACRTRARARPRWASSWAPSWSHTAAM